MLPKLSEGLTTVTWLLEAVTNALTLFATAEPLFVNVTVMLAASPASSEPSPSVQEPGVSLTVAMAAWINGALILPQIPTSSM